MTGNPNWPPNGNWPSCGWPTWRPGVANLEELLKMPGCLASPPDLEIRVGDLEALTAMLLPAVWARNQPQLAPLETNADA
jgi:hypothetical protein